MRLSIHPTCTLTGKTSRYVLISGIALSSLLPNAAAAQEEEINSEYRVTFVPTYPLSKKVFLTTYAGYVNIPSDNRVNYYAGAPLLVTYRHNQIVEAMAGAFLVFSRVDGHKDNTEFRPLAGLKLNLPNSHNLNLFSWTRYELRTFFYDDESLHYVRNRLRNRFAVEIPLSKNAWAPKTFYGFTDFEVFYTVEKGYFDRFRERIGFGRVLDKHWRVEMIYHIQMLKASKDQNPVWTDNIFRLNIKWTIPHAIHGPVPHAPDVED